jgi:Tfp pilus assembly protein FimT
MTTAETQPKGRNTVLYIVIGAIVVILMIIGLAVYRSREESAAAQAKADELIAALQANGLPAPTSDQVVRVFGDDGGAVCSDPANALKRAIVNFSMSNGAGGPGMRPVIADRLTVRGELLILKIYCPDKLPEFTKYAEKLKFADVVKE